MATRRVGPARLVILPDRPGVLNTFGLIHWDSEGTWPVDKAVCLSLAGADAPPFNAEVAT